MIAPGGDRPEGPGGGPGAGGGAGDALTHPSAGIAVHGAPGTPGGRARGGILRAVCAEILDTFKWIFTLIFTLIFNLIFVLPMIVLVCAIVFIKGITGHGWISPYADRYGPGVHPFDVDGPSEDLPGIKRVPYRPRFVRSEDGRGVDVHGEDVGP